MVHLNTMARDQTIKLYLLEYLVVTGEYTSVKSGKNFVSYFLEIQLIHV